MERESALDESYDHLITLWTSGVRDYHSMLSDYLTANSIFVAVIGLIVSRELLPLSLTVMIILLCVFGVLMCLQMAIVLGRLSGQNALWEWRLRGIELTQEWQGQKLITALYRLHETQQPIEDLRNEPPVFKPNWASRQHRQWWGPSRRQFSLVLRLRLRPVLLLGGDTSDEVDVGRSVMKP
jgi:hypothetical protein